MLLKKDKDYVLSYGNNKNASSRYNKPYVEISGIGLYRSGVRKYFTINPIKVSGETVKVTKTNFGNGSMLDFLKNNVVVTYKGTQILSGDLLIMRFLLLPLNIQEIIPENPEI